MGLVKEVVRWKCSLCKRICISYHNDDNDNDDNDKRTFNCYQDNNNLA